MKESVVGTEAMVKVPLKLASGTPAMVTLCPVEKPCAAVVVMATTLEERTAPVEARTAPLVAIVAVLLVGGEAGAVNRPLGVMVPTVLLPPAMSLTAQETPVLEDPVTVAINWSVSLVPTTACEGVTRTITPEPRSTMAVPLAVVSAVLTALMVTANDVIVPLPLVALLPVCEYVNVVVVGTVLTVKDPLKLESVTPAIITSWFTTKLCAAVVVTVTTSEDRAIPVEVIVAVAGAGSTSGAVYKPAVVIVPTVEFPP